jgi:hypothetical protein
MSENNWEARPYAHEHSCRLKPPDYKKYARKNCYKKHDGKCIDFIFGINDDGKSELQAMRYNGEIWTEGEARAHCKDNDGTFEPAKKETDSRSEAPERRYFPIEEMQCRAEDGGKLIIEGYPIVYGKYADLWGVKEIIREGAATNALKKSQEFVLWNHDTSQPMATKKNGTLKVKEDEKGVFISADVSKTLWGRQGYEAISNGVVDKMSFAFHVLPEGEVWSHKKFKGEELSVREIVEFEEIFDYSPVPYPAYKDTIVEAKEKDIALRNMPRSEASEEADTAVLDVYKKAKSNLENYK